MRIGFDAKRITHNATGLGNYSRFVVNALSEFYPDNEYILYSPSPGKEGLRNRIHPSPNVHFSYPRTFLGKKASFLWRSGFIAKRLSKEGVDLFHGLSNELPWGLKSRGIPSVVSIHDLIFLRYPQYYKPIDRLIYAYKFRKACEEADKIVAVSEMTKQDIGRFFHIHESKIEVVYQNCDMIFSQTTSDAQRAFVREKYRLPEKFILCVGSMEERKNLLLAVRALKSVKGDIPLVAIGKETEYTSKVKSYIQENHLSHRAMLLHDVPFQDLPAIYQMASVFVYPSFFEGFGIPIVEALWSGVPVIAAKGSCLEEAGGDDSIYIDPHNASELASAINNILDSNSLSEIMIRSGKEYALKFSDSSIAPKLMDVYKNC